MYRDVACVRKCCVEGADDWRACVGVEWHGMRAEGWCACVRAEDWHADGSCSGIVCVCIGMTRWRAGADQRKEKERKKHTHLGVGIIGVVRACGELACRCGSASRKNKKKKEKHTWVWGELACVRGESWRADVDPHEEREKNKEKKILACVWMMDARVPADVLRADAD